MYINQPKQVPFKTKFILLKLIFYNRLAIQLRLGVLTDVHKEPLVLYNVVWFIDWHRHTLTEKDSVQINVHLEMCLLQFKQL